MRRRLVRALTITMALIAVCPQVAGQERKASRVVTSRSDQSPIHDKNVLAADCRRAVSEFVAALDKALAADTFFKSSYKQYVDLHRRYLWPGRNWIDSEPDRPRLGCNVDEVFAIAERSLFFYETRNRPDWSGESHLSVVFQNWYYQVSFLINRTTGALAGPTVRPRLILTPYI